MHTRRIATFLLGAWIGCSLLMDFLALENLHAAGMVASTATPPALKLLKLLSTEDAGLLLRYEAVELNRYYAYEWENIEIVLSLILALCLVMGTQKRIVPLALCVLMIVALGFQHFAVTPEMAYRGRDVDFPPGNTAFGPQSRALAMSQIYGGLEAFKLLLGGILTSYLFVFRTSRRPRKKTSSSEELNPTPMEG